MSRFPFTATVTRIPGAAQGGRALLSTSATSWPKGLPVGTRASRSDVMLGPLLVQRIANLRYQSDFHGRFLCAMG
jgi:hypothetical protein